jgi:hypothetical protein
MMREQGIGVKLIWRRGGWKRILAIFTSEHRVNTPLYMEDVPHKLGIR